MMILPSPYQGPLGYFLILEIFAVVGLSWVVVAMMIRRIRYRASESLVPELQDQLAKIEEHPEYVALMTQNQLLQSQLNEKSTSEIKYPEEVEKLKSTIQFLEKKLLEYEIVQEEISTLGDIKVENEKLKAELQVLKNQGIQDSTETLPSETLKEKDLKSLLSDIEVLADSNEASSTVPSLDKKTG